MITFADCAVTVASAKDSAKWWTEKLGFKVHVIGPGGHAVMVAPAGDRFLLHLCEGFAPVEPGNTGIAFVTDDIAALVERMISGGVQFPEPLKQESWGGHAKFADPDGNVFWLLGAPAPFIRAQMALRAPPDERRRAPSKRSKRPRSRKGRDR